MAPEQPSSQYSAAGAAGAAGTAGHAGSEPDADWLIESIERRVEAFDADAGEPAEAELSAPLPEAEHDGPPAG